MNVPIFLEGSYLHNINIRTGHVISFKSTQACVKTKHYWQQIENKDHIYK